MEQVRAGIFDKQKPTVLVLIDTGIGMGDLPEQMVEVRLGGWRFHLLGKVATAGRVGAEAAFGLGGDFYVNGRIVKAILVCFLFAQGSNGVSSVA